MPVAVTGSIATDHLMHFPGKFSEQLLADQLHKVSLSFLVDDLVVRRGGVARQHRYGMGQLGRSAGARRRGRARTSPTTGPGWSGTASTAAPCTSRETAHTARFVCTTDDDMCQIASFYAGRDGRGRALIELAAGRGARPALDLVVISAVRPGRRWSSTPTSAASAATASPPTRRSRSPGCAASSMHALIEGADVLFTNDYEKSLLESKTG